jgi:hypothetical protein
MGSDGMPVPSPTGSVNGYAGGIYETPSQVGLLTMTSVSGSFATTGIEVRFSFAGGTGTLSLPGATFAVEGS